MQEKIGLKKNPQKSGWSNYNRNELSYPEKQFKIALINCGVSVTQFYMPPESDRQYEIDFAIIDKKIAFEVNGGQHYESGKLKPYYQERHDHFKNLGWTVHEIHYYEAQNLEKATNIIKNCLSNIEINYSSSPEIISYKDVKKSIKIEKDFIKYLVKLEKLKIKNHKDYDYFYNLSLKDKEKFIKEIIKIKIRFRFEYKTKLNRPSKEELYKLIKTNPLTTIGKIYGVSGNAVKKWCKNFNIQYNYKGYWAKKKSNDIKPSKDILEKMSKTMTITSIAEKLNVSHTTISSWLKIYNITSCASYRN